MDNTAAVADPKLRQYLSRYIQRQFRIADPEDLVQETLMKLCAVDPATLRTATFQTFAITVARNLCLEKYRYAKRKPLTLLSEVNPGDVPEPADESPSQDRAVTARELVAIATAKLKAEERNVLTLIYAQDMDFTDAAEALGRKYSTIKVIHWRALRKMRATLERQHLA